MNYIEMKKEIEKMADLNYMEFIKALISFEQSINDEDILDKLYERYMDIDEHPLLSDEFLIFNKV